MTWPLAYLAIRIDIFYLNLNKRQFTVYGMLVFITLLNQDKVSIHFGFHALLSPPSKGDFYSTDLGLFFEYPSWDVLCVVIMVDNFCMNKFMQIFSTNIFHKCIDGHLPRRYTTVGNGVVMCSLKTYSFIVGKKYISLLCCWNLWVSWW